MGKKYRQKDTVRQMNKRNNGHRQMSKSTERQTQSEKRINEITGKQPTKLKRKMAEKGSRTREQGRIHGL